VHTSYSWTPILHFRGTRVDCRIHISTNKYLKIIQIEYMCMQIKVEQQFWILVHGRHCIILSFDKLEIIFSFIHIIIPTSKFQSSDVKSEVVIDYRHLTGPTKASASLRANKRCSGWSSIKAAPPCWDCMDLNTLPTIWTCMQIVRLQKIACQWHHIMWL